MSSKRMERTTATGTTSVDCDRGEIEIPELEAHALSYEPRNKPWTEREKAIIRKYYGRVPKNELLKHLPGRTVNALENQAKRLKNGEC